MDKHERGWEIQEGRLDMPLPQWKGGTRGDRRRLPKVVQKLLQNRPLTPEEKAELLWRFHELEQARRVRQRALFGTFLVVAALGVMAAVAAYPPPWLRAQILRVLGTPPG
ncbi:MAG TPA: hypothetical protein VF363_11080 [Candidatus Eisenbacteria bacterium]